jgi:sulfate adenylyltransferase subunit 2
MDHLSQLESRSIYIIREAYSLFPKIALLWSIGKDSTSLLWITRKAFFGKIPFPVIHIDTTFKFKEIYEFRERYAEIWQLDLRISKNVGALRQGISPVKDKLECCNALKTEALKATLKQSGFNALILGIRRDEHGIRAKERYFSPRDSHFTWNYRNQPAELWDSYSSKPTDGRHFRIHPLLHWTEEDIWRYVQREKIPVVSLYFAKDGKRYRSIGCRTCCMPVPSKANTIGRIIREIQNSKVSERAGRAQDKEDVYTMQKLRSLGYM